MSQLASNDTPGLSGPLLVSVKDAAAALGISTWSCYQLLDAQKIESRYIGRRRLVEVESLRKYVKNLPRFPEA